MTDAKDRLVEHLVALESGPIEDRDALLRVLVPAWHSLQGGNEHGMYASKLSRLEDPAWTPPHLTFAVERHGAAVLGSINAEVQHWTVHTQERWAEVTGTSSRRIGAAQPAFKVEPVAEEIARLVAAGSSDDCLRWSATGAAVQLRLDAILPPSAKQTYEGRRRRLQAALEPLLAEHGYTYERGWYRRNPAEASSLTIDDRTG